MFFAESDYQEPFRHNLSSDRQMTISRIVDKVKTAIEMYEFLKDQRI